MFVNVYRHFQKRDRMAITVQELAQCIDKLSLSTPRIVGKCGMKIGNLTLNGREVSVRLASDLESISIPFEPSVFQGTGAECRKGIVFDVPESVFAAFASVEEFCRQSLDAQSLWCSSLRPSERYPATLKAKINVAGDRTAKFYNEANEPADPPTNWRRLPCNAVVQLRGCYVQKQSVGMLFEVYHLQYNSEPTKVEEVSPF